MGACCVCMCLHVPAPEHLCSQHNPGRTPRPQVVLVNPCNPTGVMLTEDDVARAAEMTRKAGAWLILDNT